MAKVTDPALLAELNADDDQGSLVTDPDLLRELNSEDNPSFLDSLRQQLSTYMHNPSQYAKDVGKNALDITLGAGDSLRNFIANIANLAPGVNIPEYHSGEGTAYKAGNILGELGSFLGGGEALEGARLAGETSPYIAEIAKALSGKGLSRGALAKRALGAGAYGAIQNPEDRQGEVAKSALTSLGIDTLLGGAGKGINATREMISGLRPSVRYRGELTPEELERNLNIAQGTGTNLGDIVESPKLKRLYENELSSVPGSNVYSEMLDTAAQVRDKGENLLSQLGSEEEKRGINSSIYQALKDAYKETRNKSNKNYEAVNNKADEIGLKINRDNFSQEANDILKEINESKELKSELPDSFIKNIESYTSGKDQTKLKLSNIFRGKLGEKSSKHYEQGDIYESGIYTRLKDALQRDMNEAIEKSNNPKIKELHDKAQQFYRENVAPFEEPEIAKFTRGKGDSDLILSTFIRKGQTDRGNLINKLMSKLPEEKKNLVPYSYFSQAIKEDKFNPLAFKTLYKNLGENQREILLGKELKRKMDDYVRLVEMNTEPLSIMANPKTGQRGLGLWGMGSKALGTLLGSITHGLPGAIAGMTVGAAAPAFIGNQLSKKLTNEAFRNAIVNKMINQKVKKNTLSLDQLTNLARGLSLIQQNNENP